MTSKAPPWLGGDPHGQWANHYELLGLPVGFADTETIARIADELTKRLESQALQDPQSNLQTLKDAVLQAKTCLTDDVAREAYDRRLTDTFATNEPILNSDIPTAIPVASPVATAPSPIVPFPTQRQSRSSLRRQRRSRFWFTVGSVVVGGGLFVGLVFSGKRLFLDEPSSIVATDNTHQPTTTTSSDAVPAKDGQPDGQDLATQNTMTTESNTTLPITDQDRPGDVAGNQTKSSIDVSSENVTPPSAPAVETPQPLSEQELRQLSQALDTVIPALARQQFRRANNALRAAKEIARHPNHLRLVDGLSELIHYMQEYWAGMDDAWDDLKAGHELVVGTTRVNIVEITSERLTLRVAGMNRRYSRGEIPAGLQHEIIDRWLDDDAASSHLIRGAYHATKPDPDFEKAREAWQEAKLRGAEIDLLSPVLNASYDVDHLRDLDSET